MPQGAGLGLRHGGAGGERALPLSVGHRTDHEYRSSPDKVRAFCKVCGSPIYSAKDDIPGVLRLRLGTVDTPFVCSDIFHIFTDSKAPWWEIGDGHPRYANASREPYLECCRTRSRNSTACARPAAPWSGAAPRPRAAWPWCRCPGLDVAGDVALLMELIPAINRKFGLTPEQIESSTPIARVMVYAMLKKVGADLVGREVTKKLVLAALKKVSRAWRPSRCSSTCRSPGRRPPWP
jgi:hypothetical protein